MDILEEVKPSSLLEAAQNGYAGDPSVDAISASSQDTILTMPRAAEERFY